MSITPFFMFIINTYLTMNINKIKLSGTTYSIQDENACKVVELTQAQYDALPATAKTSNTLFVITDATAGDLSNYYTKSETSGATEISTALASKADTATTYTKTEVDNAITAATSMKQDTLVSGTNIKTINNESILGSGNIEIQGGGGSASSAITSGDTNPVQGGVLFDELRIPITSEVETILEWENYDGGDTTNYPTGASKLVFYVDENEMTEGYFYFKDDGYNELGKIFIEISNGNISVTDYENVTYTISGDVVTVNYPSIAADVVKINSSYDCYWTVKAYTSGIVYEPLIDQVSANTISIQGKQDTLVSGTNIKTINNESILGSGNIEIQGGGGKAIEAGRGISITTGETADTVSFDLPISAGTGTNSVIFGDSKNQSSGAYAFAGGSTSSILKNEATKEASFAFGKNCKANGDYSHAEGFMATAAGDASHAEGHGTKANGGYSHAEGKDTKASEGSHAEGRGTTASGLYSHAEGYSNNANNQSEHASGQYNVSSSASTTFGNSGNTLFSVGNGTADNARHNAIEIRQNGDIYITKDGQDVKLQDQLGGGSITVDSALSSTSENPVQNKVIYQAIGDIETLLAAI